MSRRKKERQKQKEDTARPEAGSYQEESDKKAAVKQLQEQIANLECENQELLKKLQRVSADYANFQKRAPKQISDTIAYEKEKLIKSLLPAIDNFEHTIAKGHSTQTTDALLKGVRIVYDQLLDILNSAGVEQIHAMGECFNPSLHQAILRKNVAESRDNEVLEEFQTGYKLNGRVIRPSQVIVGHWPKANRAGEQ